MRKVILFGGTFDPIHFGHIEMARRAKEQVGADEVVFILAKRPRWKSPAVDVRLRLDMLRLGIQNINGFSISLFEVDSESEINYTIDTIRHFCESYKTAELYYLIGFDQVAKFPDWKDGDQIASLAHVIAYGRADYPLDQKIVENYKMTLVNGPLLDVSSTAIRELRSLDTPYPVISYIVDQDLYFMKKLHTFINNRRLEHSVSVAKLAYSIAENNGLSPQKAFIAGLLHDIGKEHIHDAAMLAKIKEIYFDENEDLPKFAYHQFSGSLIAASEFAVKDPEIIEAIRYHATGKANMSPLGMVIYSADKIEPTRGFDSTELIKACIENYEQGFIEVLQANRAFLLGKKSSINNPLTNACMKMYTGEVQ